MTRRHGDGSCRAALMGLADPTVVPKPTATRRVRIVEYDARWALAFEAERRWLREAFGPAALAIHHVGSTSVPGLCAKPVIDILIEASDLSLIDAADGTLEEAGFEVRGEYGIRGRRYFSKPSTAAEPAVHVHTFQAEDDQIGRHLRFRDYLRAHPDEASSYGALKRRLAAVHPEDPESYQAGKTEFIRELESRAERWERRRA